MKASWAHAKEKHGGQHLLCFTGISWRYVARKHGSDTKQMIKVEDFIMQAKEWLREFGRWNHVEHADTRQQGTNKHQGKK
jgi:hypothetical protein